MSDHGGVTRAILAAVVLTAVAGCGSTQANGLVSGSYSNDVNIVGLQLTYTVK